MRWLRWTILCRRGRRCADLVVEDGYDPRGLLDRTVTVVLKYECATCGTRYRRAAIIGAYGSVVHDDRERVTTKGAR